MDWLRLVGLAGLAAGAVYGGATAGRPNAFADLADRARALPPEFAAEALLRIADGAGTADLAWKREVLEDAFHLAANAQQPFARRNWTGKPGTLFDKAYAQGLDTATLQSKAIHAMLAIDYKKARELFGEIAAPSLARLTCEDSMVPDVSMFYTTVGDVAARAFSAKEVAQEEPFRLLQRYASDMTSPMQAAPIARMLAAASLKPAQLEALAASFAGVVGQLSSDDRSFSAAVAGDTESAIAALAAHCAHRKVNGQAVVDAWQGYATRQQGATRCADSAVLEARPEGQCDSLECRHLSVQFTGLVMAPNGYGLTPEQKQTSEWGAKFLQYLAELADWTQDDNPVEYFQYKGRFYSELFNLTPSGPGRDLVLTVLLGWLRQNGYQRDHRVEWFYPVNALIIQAFSDPAGMNTTVRELRRSNDPVIALYTQLEQMLPRPIGGTLGLL